MREQSLRAAEGIPSGRVTDGESGRGRNDPTCNVSRTLPVDGTVSVSVRPAARRCVSRVVGCALHGHRAVRAAYLLSWLWTRLGTGVQPNRYRVPFSALRGQSTQRIQTGRPICHTFGHDRRCGPSSLWTALTLNSLPQEATSDVLGQGKRARHRGSAPACPREPPSSLIISVPSPVAPHPPRAQHVQSISRRRQRAHHGATHESLAAAPHPRLSSPCPPPTGQLRAAAAHGTPRVSRRGAARNTRGMCEEQTGGGRRAAR